MKTLFSCVLDVCPNASGTPGANGDQLAVDNESWVEEEEDTMYVEIYKIKGRIDKFAIF